MGAGRPRPARTAGVRTSLGQGENQLGCRGGEGGAVRGEREGGKAHPNAPGASRGEPRAPARAALGTICYCCPRLLPGPPAGAATGAGQVRWDLWLPPRIPPRTPHPCATLGPDSLAINQLHSLARPPDVPDS